MAHGVLLTSTTVFPVRYSLINRGLVDRDRLIIRGGSAGGFTTLAALAFRDAFAAGSSYYGIGDLEAMALDTHKFESRYLDTLVGPYPAAIDVYRERSAIHHIDKLSSAMILFQGLDDKVVPPNQSVTMADAVRARGLPVTLLTFEGEGHGFRMADTIGRPWRLNCRSTARSSGSNQPTTSPASKSTTSDPSWPVCAGQLSP